MDAVNLERLEMEGTLSFMPVLMIFVYWEQADLFDFVRRQ
jgi:hypothetical protein